MFERFNGNVVPFADESTSTNRTIFGSETQSDDIDDNLNADFKKGWEIVGLNDNPTREDFNAMGYTLGYLTSYLYQNGVAEYNLLQEYKTNSIAIGTDGNIYQSLVDNNIGNALTDTTKWICIASKNSIVNSIAELKTISNIESINVLGYYEKGDGGGGTFYWDATSTETENGGTIIQATGITTGRWKRVFSGTVNVKWFGAKGDGVTDDTVAFNATTAYISNVFAPSGIYIVDTLTAPNLYLIGEGIGKTIIKLISTATTNTILDVDTLRLNGLTLSDGGRPILDHTAGAAYLCDCVDGFDSRHVEFLTDRSVLFQSAIADSSYTNIKDCLLARVTEAISNEYDRSNIFTLTQVRHVNFSNLQTSGDMVGRSIINATNTQSSVGLNEPVIANIERCSFSLFRHNGLDVNAEVKVIFLQGYLARVVQNQFVDCFGRHIDILSNYDEGSTNGTLYKSLIENNKVDFTTSNSTISGATFNEAGSIYCRYSDVIVSGNHQDFTNLMLTSNIYTAISVRHGYKSAVIYGNTIIEPKAHAINADISDMIDTDKCNVTIRDNVIQKATNGIRRPISIYNNATSKTFDTVIIEGNSIEYSSASSAIELNSFLARASSFTVDSLTVRGNWNKTFKTFDEVSFLTFPAYIFAPNTNITISVDTEGINATGVITSLSDAIAVIGRYRCNVLTIGLANTVATTQTVIGPTYLTALPQRTLINGNNGFSGRIRFYTSGVWESGIITTLSGNDIEFNGCIFNSDSGTSKTALVNLLGWGHAQLTNCEAQHAEHYIDSRGPDFSIKAGTINNIALGNSGNRSILYVLANRLVKCSIEGSTGATNTRLYNFQTPSVFLYENISVGTTAGLKNYTLVS